MWSRQSEGMFVSACCASLGLTIPPADIPSKCRTEAQHFHPLTLFVLRYRSTVPITGNGQDVTADFSLQAGQTATFVFGDLAAVGELETPILDKRFHRTSKFWRSWVERSSYKGCWREVVLRSALVLKLLINRKHGSIIAAPTFSLPENVGGVRNWDYRFTWLRDAAFTLYALIL